MASRGALDAGAAFGVAAFIVSVGSLLAQHAPDLNEVVDSAPGGQVENNLRVAELASGAIVVLAGGAASLAIGKAWPLAVTLAAVGGSIAVYEVSLRLAGRRSSS